MELEQLDSAEQPALVETPWDLRPQLHTRTIKFTLKGQLETSSSTTKGVIQDFMWAGLRRLDDVCNEMSVSPEALSQLRTLAFEQMYNISEEIWNDLRNVLTETDENNEEPQDLSEFPEDFWLSDEEVESALCANALKLDDSDWTPESETLESPHCP